MTPTPTTTREPAPAPSLTIDEGMTLVNDLDGDEVIDPGDTIKYIITYENTGEADATKVTIVDDYNQALIASITKISSEGREDGGTIIWDLGTVGAGAGGSVTYEATLKGTLPPGSTTIENTVTIASNETGSVSATNTILVKGPNLTVLKGKKLVKDLDADETIDPGDTIIWELGTVEAGAGDSVTYEATLKDTFPPGSTSIENTVTVASAEIEPESAQASILVEVAPTPTPGPTPAPEPTPEPGDEGPKAGIFAEYPLIPSILTGFLAVVATFVLVYVGAHAQYSSDDEDKRELSGQRIAMVREGVFLIFIVSAILILAMGGGIAQDGAISILPAIVGYVFGREATRS